LQEHLLHRRVVKGESREPLGRRRDQIPRLPELRSSIEAEPWGLVDTGGAQEIIEAQRLRFRYSPGKHGFTADPILELLLPFEH
jgi:hypothetical protein